MIVFGILSYKDSLGLPSGPVVLSQLTRTFPRAAVNVLKDGCVALLVTACFLPQYANADEPIVKTEKSQTSVQTSEGRKLTDKMNCRTCHIIEGDGGTIGPPLDGIGAHRKPEEILLRLEKSDTPKKALPPYVTSAELMSHVRLPASQAKEIASYLFALPETKLKWAITGHRKMKTDAIPPGSHFVPRENDAASERGKALYYDHGCSACHTLGAGGGHLGPTLAGVGARRSRAFIESRIENGALIGPTRSGEYKRMGYRMPPTAVSKKEIREITDFLLTLPKSSK